MVNEAFFAEIIDQIAHDKPTKNQLSRLKHKLCKKYKIARAPTDIDILLHVPSQRLQELQPYLQTKPVRTGSGVVPLALMTKPLACPHGKCTYCPGGPGSVYGDVPMSYTGKEPSTMRAIRNHYDCYLIVMNRLEQYTVLGHSQDKVELIIQGGTFCAFDADYQDEVVRDALNGMNDFGEMFFTPQGFDFDTFKSFFLLPGPLGDKKRTDKIHAKLLDYKKNHYRALEEAQQVNETSNIRCIGLTIETKPDWGKLIHGNQMLRLGCTRVELGVQSVYDDVLHRVHRGHTMQDTFESFQILKDLGLKITAHYMPGLPLTNRERDLAGMKQLFLDPRLRPDQLKIYPCMVAPGTPLYIEYQRGSFTPLNADEAASLITEFRPTIPEYCRVLRVNRDVPTKQWAAGVEMTNLRQYMDEQYSDECRCIRCREPNKPLSDSIELVTEEYEASGGKEFFFHFEDTQQDFIVGFCRMRYPGSFLRPEITPDSALIRELHVYGTAVAIGENAGEMQHRGFGRQLMHAAEKKAQSDGKKKMVVISGIGVREYYKTLGYHKEGPYMVKEL